MQPCKRKSHAYYPRHNFIAIVHPQDLHLLPSAAHGPPSYGIPSGVHPGVHPGVPPNDPPPSVIGDGPPSPAPNSTPPLRSPLSTPIESNSTAPKISPGPCGVPNAAPPTTGVVDVVYA